MIEVLERKITIQEFQEMTFPEDDFYIYELINGIIMRKAAPQPMHQFIVRRLSKAFEKLLDENPLGEFLTAPIDVFFDKYSRAQPDLLFIREDRTFIIDLVDGIMGAPDLIVEIISPGSVRMDRVDKKALYEEFGVKEYWIIDPNNHAIEIFSFKNDRYLLKEYVENEGKINSDILVGLDLDVKTLFV
jgi:Uma2 family endonuclease